MRNVRRLWKYLSRPGYCQLMNRFDTWCCPRNGSKKSTYTPEKNLRSENPIFEPVPETGGGSLEDSAGRYSSAG